MKRITTTIKRHWLNQIVAGIKRIEYREIKPYWIHRLEGLTMPFELRLINGMSKAAPEVTLLINKVTKDDLYQLHIARVMNVRHLQAA